MSKFPLSVLGRVSFESVFTPTAMEEGKPKSYGFTLLIPKDPKVIPFPAKALNHPAIKKMLEEQPARLKAMREAADAAARQEFGVGCGQMSKKAKKVVRNPFRDGEEKAHLDGYGPDILFVPFKRFEAAGAPSVTDLANNPIGPGMGGFYSGCWAHCTYTVYPYEFMQIGVAFGLVNVQKVLDDAPFSGAFSDPADDFESVDLAEMLAGEDDSPF